MKTFKYKNILSKKFLIKQYIKNKKSLGKISQEMNINKTTILEYLKMNNIKIRTMSQGQKGNRLLKETKKKISLANAGKNNPNWKGGITLKKYYCKGFNCNNEINWQTAIKGKHKCRNCSQKGKNAPMYGRRGKEAPMFGKIAKHGNGTHYKGNYMRSSWEIAFAYFLDLSGIKYLYEHKTFNLGDSTYTPDFYIPEWDCYIEIKGWWRDDANYKFNRFKKLYPSIKIELLMKSELQQLGVL